MIALINNYLHYDFVQHALFAGSLAAVLGAVVGYFVILRNIGFAVHALAHIGFAGATGAALFFLSPLEGMLLISIAAGMMMGGIGHRLARSDIAIGMVLSFSLGIGTLCLALYKGFAGETTAILFGNIFGVSRAQIIQTLLLSLMTLGVLAVFSRRLLFISLQPDLAEAQGISLGWLSTILMVIVAISVTLASQVVGVLLVFSLVIGPASIATRLCRNFWNGLGLSIVIALITVWSGILLACLTNWPPSFWITGVLFALYVVTEIVLRFSIV